MTLEQLRRIIAACPDDTGGRRDRALLLIGVGIAARRGELAGLRSRNVEDLGDGLRVTTLFGKRGGRSVVVSAGRNPLTDPVQAWRDWAAIARLDPGGPAFLQVDKGGNLGGGLGDRGCGERVTACGDRAGVYGLKGHSLRVALVTTARSAEKPKPIEVIADQGGWTRNSSALLGYIRIVDELVENATIGIGL
ncbi:tyrosine-type recombinase/integrase [Actinomadura syzygii]|uniref:tyrosine-type recombinase/integrase n=1 Tax=Actinomadura syzygii TaxID=1427538 RepID=UPI001FED00D7|nr:tyrosine-type recombinase/integrase [Actinomadura syzygii]